MSPNTKLYPTTSCSIRLEFPGPDSVAQYDREAGETGACLLSAVQNDILRDTIDEWQSQFTPILESLTGVTRGVDDKRTEALRARRRNPEKTKPVLEKFTLFFARATSSLPDDKLQEIKKHAVALSHAIRVNPARKVAQERIPQGIFDKIDSVLMCTPDSIEQRVERWLELVPEFDLIRETNEVRTPKRESLAKLFFEYTNAKMQQE